MRQGPLAGRYSAAAAMVVFALIPYLVLSAALQPITPIIAQQLHMSGQAMNLTDGMANAGYASAPCCRCSWPSTCPSAAC